jgi:hypothetical protein
MIEKFHNLKQLCNLMEEEILYHKIITIMSLKQLLIEEINTE